MRLPRGDGGGRLKLGLCTQVLYDRPLDEALETAARLRFQAVEIPVARGSPHVDLEMLLQPGAAEGFSRKVASHGLAISAVSNHAEGQLVLGPHHRDTDAIFEGSPEEKVRHGTDRLIRSAELASRLQVNLVVGFCGCEDYSRWFPWPDPKGWESMGPVFVERWGRILDAFDRLGVRFAMECHPKEFAYNLETAEETVRLLGGRRTWGFNLDPANLLLAGVDPVVFAQSLGDRILHVHAKDGELVRHNAARSGLLAHGPWDRRDRGFRFRIPGWGDVDWKRLLTELRLASFEGVLAVEHEDPTMSRLDGLVKARDFLRPLLFEGPREARWW
ncbi:MAG: sugar phosphate isomerase/epimerase [Planctomycetes bacterium]|nr:sugar phosphate isomerase/epimerase [Planctomycetota bacterium]